MRHIGLRRTFAILIMPSWLARWHPSISIYFLENIYTKWSYVCNETLFRITQQGNKIDASLSQYLKMEFKLLNLLNIWIYKYAFIDIWQSFHYLFHFSNYLFIHDAFLYSSLFLSFLLDCQLTYILLKVCKSIIFHDSKYSKSIVYNTKHIITDEKFLNIRLGCLSLLSMDKKIASCTTTWPWFSCTRISQTRSNYSNLCSWCFLIRSIDLLDMYGYVQNKKKKIAIYIYFSIVLKIL